MCCHSHQATPTKRRICVIATIAITNNSRPVRPHLSAPFLQRFSAVLLLSPPSWAGYLWTRPQPGQMFGPCSFDLTTRRLTLTPVSLATASGVMDTDVTVPLVGPSRAPIEL